MADTTKVTLEETFNDYEKTPVPEKRVKHGSSRAWYGWGQGSA